MRQAAKTERLTRDDLQRFRKRLLELKRRLGGVLSRLEEEALRPVGGEAAGGLSDIPVPPADMATEIYSEDVAIEMLENEAQVLSEVLDALDRIQQGTFGRCEQCEQPISRERLEALPHSRFCAQCARQLQGKPWK